MYEIYTQIFLIYVYLFDHLLPSCITKLSSTRDRNTDNYLISILAIIITKFQPRFMT